MACCPPPPSAIKPTTSSVGTNAIASPKVHIHLHVRDLAASVNFYRALFGTDPIKLLPGYAKFLPSWGPVNLALSQQAADDRGTVVSHLGIQLTSASEVRRQLARLEALGMPMRVEMGVDCCHANADKFWVIDPAGVSWEIYYLNHDLDPVESSPDAVCATTCCPA